MFSVEAAQAVTGAEAVTLGLLARRNLLEKVTEERAVLHPALAAVAARRAGDNLPDPRLHHAQHYLDFVNQDPETWRRIEPELEQIRSTWAHLLPPHAGEGRGGGGGLVLGYVWAMRQFQALRGLWREYLTWHQRGLTLARELNRRQDEAPLLNNIAWCYDSLGERHRALDYYEQALPIIREVGDRAGEAMTLNNIAAVYDHLGERRHALEYYEQALPIRREVGDRAGEGVTLHNIGYVYLAEGDLAQAQAHLEQALIIAEAVEYPDLARAARKGLKKVRPRWAEGG
jgi:tetratricopeptide (TPR) repeat protein